MVPEEDVPFYLVKKHIEISFSSKYNECNSNTDRFLNDLQKYLPTDIRKWQQTVPYPQNHLRNIARKNCQTRYVFLVDIDVIPSPKTGVNLNKFLKNRRRKTEQIAYVIPTFELDINQKFPESKQELKQLVDNGLSRPFHEKVFIYNQYATNFSAWLSNDNTSDVFVSHFVTNFEMFYEPFYVAEDSAPVHDERFYGYGYTRNSQVYEMYLAGYRFAVLGPMFTIHWSLQSRKNRPTWRERQNTRNRRMFNTVKQELLVRYKKSNKN